MITLMQDTSVCENECHADQRYDHLDDGQWTAHVKSTTQSSQVHGFFTIKDVWKKAMGEEAVDLRTLRRGFYVGGPLAIIQMIVSLVCVALIFTDARVLHQGDHGVTAGAVGALLVVLIISGGIRSAVWAIIKASVYVWAVEGKVAAGVDEETLKGAFVSRTGMAGLTSI